MKLTNLLWAQVWVIKLLHVPNNYYVNIKGVVTKKREKEKVSESVKSWRSN